MQLSRVSSVSVCLLAFMISWQTAEGLNLSQQRRITRSRMCHGGTNARVFSFQHRPQHPLSFGCYTTPSTSPPSSSAVVLRATDDQSSFENERGVDRDHSSTPSRWIRVRKRLRRVAVTLALASSALLHRPTDAQAAAAGTKDKPSTLSLRPGMSQSQAVAAEDGDKNVISELEQAPSVFQQSGSSGPTKKTPAFDYGASDDAEDDDDDMFDDDDFDFASSSAATQSDKATADKMQASNSKSFAAYHKGKSAMLTFKVGVCFFGPTYGFMIVREYVRRRREETYVQKGLEILAAQKAEYFNVTETTDDADVEDELKDLKNNSTDTDDEDDDDDDDDDEDDEPEPPRRAPRKPLGDPPKGGGGGSAGGTDVGDGKPSDDDLDKLNRMFGKS